MKPTKKLLIALGVLLLATPWHYALSNDDERVFSQAEIEQILAPIALYPDTVLSHLLIAATYPLEVVQAERWAQSHPDLEGAEAVAAADNQDWDPSVKALVAFPQILERMSEDLNWTQDLGDAFLADEERVLQGVQALRQRAYAEGNLKTTEYVEVVREPDTIIVESRIRDVVYIPYYDTRVVYGTWHWPGYHPVYWHRPSHYYWHSGFYWGPAIRVDHGFYFSSFHWGQRRTVVVHNHHHHFTSGRHVARHEQARHWRHDPYHRRGVEYRTVQVHRNEGQPARLNRQRGAPSENRRARPQASETRDRLRTTTPSVNTRQAPARVSPSRHSQRQERAADTRTAPHPEHSTRSSARSSRAETHSSPRSAPSPRSTAPQRRQAPQRIQQPSRQTTQQPSSARSNRASSSPRTEASSSVRSDRQHSRQRRRE